VDVKEKNTKKSGIEIKGDINLKRGRNENGGASNSTGTRIKVKEFKKGTGTLDERLTSNPT